MLARKYPNDPGGANLRLVLVLFGTAYFLSLFFRSVNAILAPTLVQELGLSPASLGLMTGAYFLGLGLMQIPIGLCLDAYGPRRVQAFLLVIAAIGIGLFAASEHLVVLVLARALIGVGLAGCLMAAFQVATLWLAKERTAFANGCYLAAGGLGVLAATAPVDLALHVIGWRSLFAIIAIGTACVAIMIAIVTPDPDLPEKPKWRTSVTGLAEVIRNPTFRGYLPLTALCFGTGTAMQGLWVSTWFSDVAGVSSAGVAVALTWMAVALTLGSVAAGTVSLFLEKRGFHLRHVVLGSALLFIVAQIGLLISPPSVAIGWWMLFALTYNATSLSYALVARSVPLRLVGRSNTSMNTVVILTTFGLQSGLGVFLGWAGNEHFDFALSMAIATLATFQLIALGWCIITDRSGLRVSV